MHKDFLDIIDYSPKELQDLLDLAIHLKKEYKAVETNQSSRARF